MNRHFMMFAAYNQWANERIFEAAADLDDGAWQRETGVFFKSLLGTLNHVLVADRIWMKRMTGTGDAPKALDVILYRDPASLHAARRVEDQRIIDWIDEISEATLAGRFTYITVTDLRTISQRLAPALAHFFNHQTHHRGHAHAILTMLGRPSPQLDLVYFQRTPSGLRFA